LGSYLNWSGRENVKRLRRITTITTEGQLYATLLLRKLRPATHLGFTELWSFDVDTFVFDGHAQRVARPDVPPVFRLIRDETNTRLEEDVRAGCCSSGRPATARRRRSRRC